MDKKSVIRRALRPAVYLLFFGTALSLAYLTPYCHDEWRWGLPDRMELMKQGFPNYNGRYLGNLLALVITRSTLWKALIPALWMVWLLRELEIFASGCAACAGNPQGRNGKTAARKAKNGAASSPFLLFAAIFLLAAVPRTLYAQSYGWLAAFVNFVPPTVLFLVYFNWTQAALGPRELQTPRWQTIAAFPLALCTQLFSEHVTAVVIVYALGILLYTRWRKGRVFPLHLSYLAASILGAVVMFSNSSYRRAAGNPDSYKQISVSLSGMYVQLRDQIIAPLFLNNWLLCALTALALTACIARRGRRTWLEIQTVLVICGFAFYCVWRYACPEWVFSGSEELNGAIEVVLCALYFLHVLLGLWLTLDPAHRLAACTLYVLSAASAVPLLAANPIGDRCFSFSYALQCAVLLRLVSAHLPRRPGALFYPTLAIASLAALTAVVYLRMFAVIGQADRYRAQLIDEACRTNAASVTLPLLPYSGYCWTTVPTTEYWMKSFKAFYHIPEGMQVTFQ